MNPGVTEDNYEITTFFFVRHAEKQKDVQNPSLNNEGKLRAQELSNMLEHVKLDAIYSTDYKRTIETAEPISKNQNIKVNLYNPSTLNLAFEEIKHKYRGQNILVVGHSNTTPDFINLIIGSQKVNAIIESEYNNLYILKLHQNGTTDLMRLLF